MTLWGNISTDQSPDENTEDHVMHKIAKSPKSQILWICHLSFCDDKMTNPQMYKTLSICHFVVTKWQIYKTFVICRFVRTKWQNDKMTKPQNFVLSTPRRVGWTRQNSVDKFCLCNDKWTKWQNLWTNFVFVHTIMDKLQNKRQNLVMIWLMDLSIILLFCHFVHLS